MIKLEELERKFNDVVVHDNDWRDLGKKWYSYYMGAQWTSAETHTLRERGQAVTTYNHIAPSIDAIIGGERQNRPDIKMAGRTLDDNSIAQIKTSLYNYITYNSNSDDELDKALIDMLVAGRGWLTVYPQVNPDGSFDDIYHEWVDYRDMYVDPLSRRDDMSDCRYIHKAVFTDIDIVKRMFPSFKGESSQHTRGFEGSSEDDIWFDNNNRQRVRLIESWTRDDKGRLTTTIWVKGEILYQKRQIYSKNFFPFVQLTYKRDLDNHPYGMVKSMVSAQDEVNKRHSKAMHYLNSKQVLAE